MQGLISYCWNKISTAVPPVTMEGFSMMMLGPDSRTSGRQNTTHHPVKVNSNQFDEEEMLIFCQNAEGMIWLTKELLCAPIWGVGITVTEKKVARRGWQWRRGNSAQPCCHLQSQGKITRRDCRVQCPDERGREEHENLVNLPCRSWQHPHASKKNPSNSLQKPTWTHAAPPSAFGRVLAWLGFFRVLSEC